MNRLALFLLVLTFVTIFSVSAYAQTSQHAIILDKKIYSWTDRVHITIIAPSYNTDPFSKEIIGDKDRELVKVATREAKLEPYILIESEPNSGVFVGWVMLTGFKHDANGDKVSDTNPRTQGTGPFDGYIQAKRGDGITVSFESNRKVFTSATAQIKWNTAELSTDKESYFIGDKMKITVIDPDMNINFDSRDELTVTVSSDSDHPGLKINAVETHPNSGIFDAFVQLAIKKPTPTGTLYVLPTDSITIKHKDRTLPAPQTASDVLTLEKKVMFRDITLPTSRVDVSNTYLKNNVGIPVIEPLVGKQVEVTSTVENKQNYEQNIVYIIQVINEEGRVVKLSWLEGNLNPYQSMVIGKQWIPDRAGNYLVETYVWNSIKSPLPLSPKISNNYLVFDQ